MTEFDDSEHDELNPKKYNSIYDFSNPYISPNGGYLDFSRQPPSFLDEQIANQAFMFPNYDENKVEALLQKIRDSLEITAQMECDMILDENFKKQYLLGTGLEKQIEKTNELKSLSDTYETRIGQLESKIDELQLQIQEKNKEDEITKTLIEQNKLLKQEIGELKKTYQPILDILKDKLQAKNLETQEQANSEEKEYGIYR